MTGLKVRVLGLSGMALLLSCAPGQPPAEPAPGAAAVGAATRSAAAAPAPTRVFPGAVATALDAARGVPRFLRATTRQAAPAGATVEAAARAHLARHAGAWRLAAAPAADAELLAVHDTGRGGVITTLRQRAHGVEILHGDVKVLMRRDLELVAVSGTPLPGLDAAPHFARPARRALADALAAHLGAPVADGDVTPVGPSPGGFERFDLQRPVGPAGGLVRLTRPARVKPVLLPVGGTLRPAWFVELFAGAPGSATSAAFRYVVAADDGRVLERRNLTADALKYRVWVDSTGRPLDGPQADFTPHPTGTPDRSEPAYVPPILIERDAFNTNPSGQPDPWLPGGATETRGNNVDAYADLQAPDGFSSGDLRAASTAAGVFDRTYDTSLAPTVSADQSQAAVTQLFYLTNWLHDWYYDSGFDEAAGNAQFDNFGRGGLASDRMFVEAQDYSEMNNANMATPSDGDSPRMQILLWSGPEQRTLHVTPPDADLATSTAEFGPAAFDLTGAVKLVGDGTAPASDACQAVTNDVSGAIALLDRGTCSFKQKALNAQAAGAVGVILINNQAGNPPYMPDGTPDGTVTIPIVSVTLADGTALKTALQAGAVTAHLTRVPGTNRDAALDNTIVSHEWAHYLHGRLADCGQMQCAAMGEGWGDFVALHLILREGDDLDGAYALAIYASRVMGDSGYYGIRRAPYSVDFTRNALTFRHIADGEALPTAMPMRASDVSNAEVHAAGEIWAMMLFEAYVALQRETAGPGGTRTFDEARRVMSDYVVAGLKLAPPEPTFTEARDGILAAAAAAEPADVDVLAAAFARRGAGTCAESPALTSYDFTGVVESFDVKPRAVLGVPTLDDSLESCDGNGRLDGGERGLLKVDVVNDSVIALAGATVTVSTAAAEVTFPAGATVSLGELAPFESTTVAVEVALDWRAPGRQLIPLDVKVAAATACQAEVTRGAAFRANYGEQEAASAVDDVEASTTTWMLAGDGADLAWSRIESPPGNHVWRGIDLAQPSNSWIESPPVQVSATERLVVTFRHRYEFERADDETGPIYYDGAVMEITTDGGVTWTDVATWADPGYGGIITNVSGNPLADRMGFVDHNPAWPEMESAGLDFGTVFAGQTVSLRFRIGTDPAAGGTGWDLDDIKLAGIDATPFAQLVDSPTACAPPPQEDAGAGADAAGADGATLDGRDLATCGGCAAGQRPQGAALLVTLLGALALVARRRRR